MRIYMQSLSGDSKRPRFCHLHLQEDLIDGWTLVRESGYQGQSGKVVREHHPDRQSAIKSMIKARDQQLSRGFRIVFAEGAMPE
jgi:hypothetical protein